MPDGNLLLCIIIVVAGLTIPIWGRSNIRLLCVALAVIIYLAFIDGGKNNSRNNSPPPRPTATSTEGEGTVRPKVKQVIEFYATWCGVCKQFKPVFAETQKHFPDIQFSSLDAGDQANQSLVNQYGVHRYPTLVYLDQSGNVIHMQEGAFTSAQAFEHDIERW